MPSVEIRVDFGGEDKIPHTFINVTDPNGVTTEYGFGPENEGTLFGRGHVYYNTDHEWQETSGTMNITDGQYNALMDYINRTTVDPPVYDITGTLGEQCTMWTLYGLSEAGIISDVLAPNFNSWLNSGGNAGRR